MSQAHQNAPLTPSVSPAKPAGPGRDQREARHGLEIVVIPDHRAPVVTPYGLVSQRVG